jgi:acyl carrier protein
MHEDTLGRLGRLVGGVLDGDIAADGAAALGRVTFEELGLDSVAILSVLVAVEDEFNIEFGDDTPPAALRSLGALAEYLEHAFLSAA